jgi:hypothetical protein
MDRNDPHLHRRAPPRIAANERLLKRHHPLAAYIERDPRLAGRIAGLDLIGEHRRDARVVEHRSR